MTERQHFFEKTLVMKYIYRSVDISELFILLPTFASVIKILKKHTRVFLVFVAFDVEDAQPVLEK